MSAEQRETSAAAGRTADKSGRYILFFLNAALMQGVVTGNFSAVGLALSAVITAAALYFTVLRAKAELPAVRDLPLLLVLDLMILGSVYYRQLLDGAGLRLYEDAGYFEVEGKAVLLLAVGLTIMLVAPKKPAFVLFKLAGWTLSGVAILYQFFGNAAPAAEELYGGGLWIMALFLACEAVWFLAYSVSVCADTTAFKRNDRLSVALLAALCLLCALERPMVESLSARFCAALDMVESGLEARNLGLAAAILYFFSVMTYDHINCRSGADSLALEFLAGAAVLLAVLQGAGFGYTWLALPVYAAGGLVCIRREASGAAGLRMTNQAVLLILTAAAAATVRLAELELWLNIAVMYACAAILLPSAGRRRQPAGDLLLWLAVLCCMTVFTAAYIVQTGLGRGALATLLPSFVFFALAYTVACWPHPSGEAAPGAAKFAVCAMMAAVCVMSAVI